MTDAKIKRVLLLTPDGNPGNIPEVILARGKEVDGGPRGSYYKGDMTYNGKEVDTLDADFPADNKDGAVVLVKIGLAAVELSTGLAENFFTGIATTQPNGGTGFDCITQELSKDRDYLTLIFHAPQHAGQTTGYTQMYFHTKFGVIDPEEEVERDPH